VRPLGVLKNWIDAGTLPAIRIGRRVRIKRSDFERLVEGGYSGGASVAAPTPGIWDGEVPPPEVTA
jgi:excisionase family DNA binding protein